MNKKLSFFLSFFLIISLLTPKLHAQLHSSGNNTISGNRVGVGTNSPTTTLHVRGNLIGANSNTAGTSIFNNPFRVTFQERVFISGESSYWTNIEKPAFFINRDGRVGINNENPTAELDVNGNLKIGNNNWTSLTFDATGNNDWMLNAHNNGNSLHIRSQEDNQSAFSKYVFTLNRNTGNVGVNVTNPSERLHVVGNVLIQSGSLIIRDPNGLGTGNNQIALNSNGTIRAREVRVDLATIPDYVFAEGYELMPLEELAEFVKTHKHLPGVKNEAQFEEEGSISLTEMNLKLLEKVEELTLYILQQEKRILQLEAGR